MTKVTTVSNELDIELLGGHLWVTVESLSVCIAKHDEGVSVDICALGDEESESVASTWALFQEGEGDPDE